MTAIFLVLCALAFATGTLASIESAADPHNPASLPIRLFWPVFCAAMTVASVGQLVASFGSAA